MALKQTLVSSSTTNLPFPRIPNNPHLTLAFLPAIANQSRRNQRLRCSVVHHRDHRQEAVDCPKPAEIPWKKELCNAVHLIGNVGTPVEIKHLPSGKVLAWTRLAVRKSPTETSWISLTFWDELAQVAFRHLEKGHQVYVSGRLVSDVVESDDGKPQTYYKVVVQQLNFIERGSSSTGLYGRDSNIMTAGGKLGNNASNDLSVEELWQAFFASPLEWWDNRKNKRNPKYPDFKHKDTGEALWVEGRYNPPWVKSQLAILDERMGSLNDRDSGMHLSSMVGDDFMPF